MKATTVFAMFYSRNIGGDALHTLLRSAAGCLFTAGLAIAVTLTGYCGAQDSSTNASQDDSSKQQDIDGQTMPLPPNLETDLPLEVISSPMKVGYFSLLSLSAYQGYDSNPGLSANLKKGASGSEFSALNALLVYSIRHSDWEFDFQYEPSAVITPDVIAKNFTANSVDFQVTRRLSPTWTFTAGEFFHYSPDLQSSIQGNSLNLGGGISIQAPFLSTQQSILLNAINGSTSHRLSKESSLTFFGGQSFIRLKSSVNFGLVEHLPVEESVSANLGASYSRTLTLRDTIGATYEYRLQSSPTFSRIGQFHIMSFNWGHVLAPGLRLSLSGGPGFWDAGSTRNQWRTTLQGIAQIAKVYRTGGIGLAFTRTNSFNGVLNNTFSNLYSLTIDRHFTTHIHVDAHASYIQQEVYGGHGLTGTTAAVQPAWMLTRNWAVFGQFRYLRTQGYLLNIAPQKIVTMGVRWDWVPEKP